LSLMVRGFIVVQRVLVTYGSRYDSIKMEIWKPSEALARKTAQKTKFSMADLKSEIQRLEIRHLDYPMFVFIADKLKKGVCPGANIVEYFLGHQILRFYLGDAWVEPRVFDDEQPRQRWHREGRAFLKSESSEIEGKLRHQDRLIKLAECLINLQHIPGIRVQRIAMCANNGPPIAQTALYRSNRPNWE
jgi:hypothetical protein